MIGIPTPDDIKTLNEYTKPGCVSMYVPYIDPGINPEPTRIQLKNMIKEAQAKLRGAHVDSELVRKTVQPLNKLLEDHSFWLKNRDDVALFAHSDLFRAFAMPESSFTAGVSMGLHFDLEQLTDAISANEHYYVLALSHNHVKLFEGDRFDLKEVHLKDLPTNMEESLGIDEYPREEQKHEVAPSYTGKGSEAYHGQYNVRQTDKAMLKEFFRRIDKRLGMFLSRTNDPLIIAGVTYLLPIYRTVNTYPHLAAKFITGNLERASYDNIRHKAWSTLNHGAA